MRRSVDVKKEVENVVSRKQHVSGISKLAEHLKLIRLNS